MILVQCIIPQTSHLDLVETFDSLSEATEWLRDLWNEEEMGEQTFLLSDEETGRLIAVMTRPDPSDPELCLTVCFEPGGSLALTSLHRCRYVIGPDGYYVRTEVTRVEIEDPSRPYGWLHL